MATTSGLAAADRLGRLAELIAASPHNLVSRSQRARVGDVHVPEAAALLPILQTRAGQHWLDLGTGGGLPGLVLAVLAPDVRWTLVDATAKKVAQVRAFADELRLGNVRTVIARAETLAHEPAHRGAYDGVVSRAVASLPVLAELARGFLRDGGHLVAVKGAAWQDELALAAGALRRLSLRSEGATRIASAARPTWVVSMHAIGPPPQGFPRRDGVPRRDPLGG